jgi:hypothetical protein
MSGFRETSLGRVSQCVKDAQKKNFLAKEKKSISSKNHSHSERSERPSEAGRGSLCLRSYIKLYKTI